MRTTIAVLSIALAGLLILGALGKSAATHDPGHILLAGSVAVPLVILAILLLRKRR